MRNESKFFICTRCHDKPLPQKKRHSHNTVFVSMLFLKVDSFVSSINYWREKTKRWQMENHRADKMFNCNYIKALSYWIIGLVINVLVYKFDSIFFAMKRSQYEIWSPPPLSSFRPSVILYPWNVDITLNFHQFSQISSRKTVTPSIRHATCAQKNNNEIISSNTIEWYCRVIQLGQVNKTVKIFIEFWLQFQISTHQF